MAYYPNNFYQNYQYGGYPQMSQMPQSPMVSNLQGKDKQMKELEKYLNELSADITEMISDASQEERDILSQKMTTLIDKVK